ncbi:uncharacterized protein LOC134197389 isoform X2 [Corticium candelabrum]|uniref:uncharacterized protein LOC134197389 isoform X2 n=1 Tax=Corticium candelabrum TaxID=121492 RepID=UPI002E267FC3|nr:uncharacterized protein LOC134197389 isoform X2 [Corticium candelabrum]
MALKRCFFAFVSLWVCSGDNGTALTLQRRADVVKSVHGVNSGKTHKVVDKFTNPMLNKDRGIKEPLGGVTGIRPSGNPVKSSVDGENFSKGKPGLPRVITEPVDELTHSCPVSTFWHPIHERCLSCQPAGNDCPHNSSCCCPGLKQIGLICKAVMCSSTEICRNCSDAFAKVKNGNLNNRNKTQFPVWPRTTPRSFSKFCKDEHTKMSSPVNKSCCTSQADCSDDECCVFKNDSCGPGVCKRSCKGKLLEQPEGCPTIFSTTTAPDSVIPSTTTKPHRLVRCKTDAKCSKGYCCVKTNNSVRGVCSPCPTVPYDLVIDFVNQYTNCSQCPVGMICINDECRFPSCSGVPPPKQSWNKYEKNCCKDKAVYCGETKCCRVLYNSSVAVCHKCENNDPVRESGRSLIKPSPPQQCRKKSDCDVAGLCCVAVAPRQGKVCSTCDSDPAAVATRDLDNKQQDECSTDSDCGDKKCCVLNSKGNKRVCKKKGCPPESNIQHGSESRDDDTFSNDQICTSNNDCSLEECCTLVANSASNLRVCKPCLAVFARRQYIKAMPCSSDDDCLPKNGSTFCCTHHPSLSRGQKHCVRRGKAESVCIVGNVPTSKFTCSCQVGLSCLPAAVQYQGLDDIGVCVDLNTKVNEDVNIVAPKKASNVKQTLTKKTSKEESRKLKEAERLQRQKEKRLERQKQKENRKKEKAAKKG